MIRVYQAMSNPYKEPNPFVYALMDGIEDKYDDVKWGWGCEKFWTERIFGYDLVLFQWPDFVLCKCGDQTHTIDDFKERIAIIKSRGIKIVSFIHNIAPHYSTSDIASESYKVVYAAADVLFHMGDYSKHVLSVKYPNAIHINLGPHYIYDQVYKKQYTREQGLVALGLNAQYQYVLAFGAFRDDEERELIKNLTDDLRNCNKKTIVLAPSYTNIPQAKNRFDIIPRIKRYKLRYKDHIICNGGTFYTVPDYLLPYYYAAADVCIIHRKKILNSGNVPMGFLMNKVVVGPNEGNVGETLRMMGNPTFDVGSRQSISSAVLKGFELANTGKGSWNYEYAMTHFSTSQFCTKFHDSLESLFRK